MLQRDFTNFLINWSKKPARKPLVVRGARQVGKTTCIINFANKNFESVVHINLDKAEHFEVFGNLLVLSELISAISLYFNVSVVPGKTLLFIDEIQNSLPLVGLLRFLKEDMPDLHVVCAGSLLEARLSSGNISFPVGRVEYGYMYPLNFFEYLRAVKQDKLLEFLSSVTLESAIPVSTHKIAIQQFYKFAMLGGMPEVVASFVQTGDIGTAKSTLSSLNEAYIDDVYKYASTANSKYLSYIIRNGAKYAGTLYKYENFDFSGFKSREISESFSLLEKSMLLREVPATNSIELPIIAKQKNSKKLIWLDVGFVNLNADIYLEYVENKDLSDIYVGRVAEQLVGQHLISMFYDKPFSLYYWAKDKSEGNAEVDFCFSYEGKFIGVEVKSGTAGRLKSLKSFAQSVDNSLLLRVYDGELVVEELSGRKFVSLPFYLLSRVLDFVK